MSWCTIREYSKRHGQAISTVRRNIQKGRIYGRKFGRNWYVHEEKASPSAQMTSALSVGEHFSSLPTESPSSLQGLLDFSSKALHHYLLMHDKVIAEKDLRLREKELRLAQMEQSVADLEGYIRILEDRLGQTHDRRKGAA